MPAAQLVDEGVVHGAVDDQAARGRALLAAAAEGAVEGRGDGDVEVGVVHHHQRVLGAHLELDLGQVGGAALAMPRPTPREPVKVMASTSGLSIKRLADGAAGAHHQVEGAGRQIGLAADDLG